MRKLNKKGILKGLEVYFRHEKSNAENGNYCSLQHNLETILNLCNFARGE
jgi:hypothetical protein